MEHNIRVRAGIAAIRDGKILLVPHYQGAKDIILWYVPGGGVEFGESLQDAAVREFLEETGFKAHTGVLLHMYENIRPEQPWHSITMTYAGHIISGELRAEGGGVTQFGDKTPRWFTRKELGQIRYHPPEAVDRAFDIWEKKGGLA